MDLKSLTLSREKKRLRAHTCIPLLSQKIGTMKISMQYFDEELI